MTSITGEANIMHAATIHERGNGLADVGDFVAGDDGEVYRIVKLIGPTHTGAHPGAGHYRDAIVTLADWSDVTDDDEPTCSAVMDSEGGRDIATGGS